MAAIPSLTPSLRKHLQAIVEDPALDLDVKLVETFTAQLIESDIPDLLPLVIPLISQVLPLLHQDPIPLVNLLRTLLSAASFSDALSFASPSTYKLLLESDISALQSLALFLLSKASSNSTDVAAVASWNQVCGHLVQVMLCAKDTGIAVEAEKVLTELLKTDLPNAAGIHDRDFGIDSGDISSPAKGGSGLLWRRIFNDKEIIELLLKACAWDGNKKEHNTKTTSQGRLLSFITKVAEMDWNAIAANPFPDLLETHSQIVDTPVMSLLDFVTFGMVNRDVEDVMIAMLHIDFFTSLLFSGTPNTKALEYLRSQRVGKHQYLLTLYFYPKLVIQETYEQHLLHPAAARYVAAYVRSFPDHLIVAPITDAMIPENKHSELKIDYKTYQETIQKFLEEASSTSSQLTLVDLLLERIEHYIAEGLRTNDPASSSLRLLEALPPQILLPQTSGNANQSLVTKIPIKPNAEYITTLSVLLASSKDLYDIYTSYYSNVVSSSRATSYLPSATSAPNRRPFWSKITSFAETFALKEVCLASMNLIIQLCRTPCWDGLSEVLEQVRVAEFIFRDVEIPGTNRGGLDPDSMGYKVSVLKHEIVKAIGVGLSQVGLMEAEESETIVYPSSWSQEQERKSRLSRNEMTEEERARMVKRRRELGARYVNPIRARLIAGVFRHGRGPMGGGMVEVGTLEI